MQPESLLKALILSNGVLFTPEASFRAIEDNAKTQNLCYNLPFNSQISRPQEVHIQNLQDGYQTVVSCVTPSSYRKPIIVDVENGEIRAKIDGYTFNSICLSFVKKPDFYGKKLHDGTPIQDYVSACGFDELNIFPWRGCAISKMCHFCGVNTIINVHKQHSIPTAFELSGHKIKWGEFKTQYLNNLYDSIVESIKADCYADHSHVIIISGNLSSPMLNEQALIYSEIADRIAPAIKEKTKEGIVAVLTPPTELKLLETMKKSGIDIVAFNLELGNDPEFGRICPGKAALGRSFFIERLMVAVDVFGFGKSWSNFVLGLEPQEALLDTCRYLARHGVTPGANVFHLDHGSSIKNSAPPHIDNIISFYSKLSNIYKENGLKPFYCSRALRTSLANEAYDERL